MPKNVYSEINLHITWHTKNDDPVLTAEIENRVHHYLENKIRETKNVIFHAGVVSFGTRDLPWVIKYVRNQKEHHAKKTTSSRLEKCWEGE